MPRGPFRGRYVYAAPVPIEQHPEFDLDHKRCSRCKQVKDSLLFDVLIIRGRPYSKLADTCLECDGVGE